MNGKQVEIIGRENSREVWVETSEGQVLRVFKSGLMFGEPTGTAAISNLRVDPRRSDGAR